MVLAIAVLLGLATGLIRAWFGKRSYQSISLRWPGLVLIAFIPQGLGFYLPRLGIQLTDQTAALILVTSQALLLVFAWVNRKQPGFFLLGAGLLLNFAVIVLNGGLMPITPEMVRKLYPQVPESRWQVGRRLGNGKDIVLLESATRLPLLSDRFFYPGWIGLPVAFSLGDIFIALGAFWLLWSLGGPAKEPVGLQTGRVNQPELDQA